MSTNMPMFGPVVLEVVCDVFINKAPFSPLNLVLVWSVLQPDLLKPCLRLATNACGYNQITTN